MKINLFTIIVCGALTSFSINSDKKLEPITAQGQMPFIVSNKVGELHLTYGISDSIMYSFSKDGGKSFSEPTMVYALPKLASSHTRGPQLAATSNGLLLTACTSSGNIFSFIKSASGKWQLTGRVNDKDTVAKENLMALSADGNNAYAIWLDLREGHNKIFGAFSSNGGKTWSKNIKVYESPNKTVCECCKPSVAVQGKNVYVMFRNWLNGNRDLYLAKSSDGGRTFSKAQN
jgi:hypothetical protein